MQIPISPQTHAALRVLVAKGIEAVIASNSPEPVRAMRRLARAIEIHGQGGRTFSGVLVIHRNVVTTGLVVDDADTCATSAHDAAFADSVGVESAVHTPGHA